MSEIFAKRLREVRENRRKTQLDVSRILGISNVSYGAWERGDTEPSIEKLVKLCQFFDVTADWLIGMDKVNAAAKAPMIGRIAALKDEADQAAATLSRLVGQLHDLEKSV